MTLPLLRPIVAVLVVFSTIWDFKIFDQIYVMAAGRAGPRGGHRGGRRLPRGLRARRTTAWARAVAVVLFLILLVFSLLYVRLIGREGLGMRWLLKRGWMYARDGRDLGVRAVPGLLGRDHVAEAAVGDLHAHAGPVAVATRSGTSTRACWARATSAAR